MDSDTMKQKLRQFRQALAEARAEQEAQPFYPAPKDARPIGAYADDEPEVHRSFREETFMYEVVVYWSEEDSAFIAEVPELAGCMAHGATEAEARANAQEAIQLWLDSSGVQ